MILPAAQVTNEGFVTAQMQFGAPGPSRHEGIHEALGKAEKAG
jgi:hypothetical protein